LSRNPLQKAVLYKESRNVKTSISLTKSVKPHFLTVSQPSVKPWGYTGGKREIGTVKQGETGRIRENYGNKSLKPP